MRLDAGNVEELVDFALNQPLTALSLNAHGLAPAAMPSLTRLVSGGGLTTLEVSNRGITITPSPMFCAAVAAAPLVRLYYMYAGLFVNVDASLSLLAAVTGHPTIRHLNLAFNINNL